MAELTLSCPKSVTSTAAEVSSVDVLRRILIRTGGKFDADTTLDIIDPGEGWVVFGDSITWSDSNEFVELTQLYRNGVIQLTASGAADDNDVYFVSASGNIAFEYKLQTNDVVQVWKFNPVTTSG